MPENIQLMVASFPSSAEPVEVSDLSPWYEKKNKKRKRTEERKVERKMEMKINTKKNSNSTLQVAGREIRRS